MIQPVDISIIVPFRGYDAHILTITVLYHKHANIASATAYMESSTNYFEKNAWVVVINGSGCI